MLGLAPRDFVSHSLSRIREMNKRLFGVQPLPKSQRHLATLLDFQLLSDLRWRPALARWVAKRPLAGHDYFGYSISAEGLSPGVPLRYWSNHWSMRRL